MSGRFGLTTNPLQKQAEAHYFLDQMRSRVNDGKVFTFNLSAFLSAAHSVIDFLRADYANREGFRLWYKRHREQFLQDREMQLLVDYRNLTIHERIVQVEGRHQVALTASLRTSAQIGHTVSRVVGGVGTQLRRLRGQGSAQRPPGGGTTTTTYRWYFDRVPDREALTVCESIMGKLDAFLTDCVTKWESAPVRQAAEQLDEEEP